MRREYWWLVVVAIIVVVVGSVVYIYGRNSALATVPFTPVLRGDQSAITRRVNYLVASPAELTRLWELIGRDDVPPTVDFSTQNVIAVFAGPKPTSGYDIKVAAIEDGVARKVLIELVSPGPACILAQSLTSPFEIVTVPRTSLTLTHEDIERTNSCLN